ncbi:TRAP transporter small permease [Aliagarivorans taiwanensis]|uniref:TRAP transporter small permease n=1 Tax=Aliagarivorans taiwanensis TaxID=561966 RepID=UPI00041C27FA|nr:TRAP transporter small permease [Aliagarivorans taiwanensis]
MPVSKDVNLAFVEGEALSMLTRFRQAAAALNTLTEYLCALLLGSMVLIVWLGVVDRYFVGLHITWTEELARYLMIWAALLAMSCGASHREHIGFTLLRDRLPSSAAKLVTLLTDLISIAFFAYLFIYGCKMTADGVHQYATIFGMSMFLPFASVPVAAALTIVQLLAAMLSPASEAHS